MHKAFPLPVIEFPLPGEVPTASEESSHYQKKRDDTAHKIALLLKSSGNCQSKSYESYAKIHFLDFFNNPRIIREQRIAAYKGYRGGGVVQIR
nr:hypothetical protein [Tanacetum cinerariifolium]